VQIRESRAKVTLVARMAASVANYDYIMDWEFQMDGLIRIKVRIRYYASDHQLPCISFFSHEK
jgi:primary-amine oxidase